jgi:ribosomal protein S27E
VSWSSTVAANTQETVIILPSNADRIENIRVYCPGSNTTQILFLSSTSNCANPNSGPQVRSACGYSFCFTWSGATCTIPNEQTCFDDASLRITATPCQ